MADGEDKDALFEAAEAQRRSALNARDRALMERFLAGDRAAEREVVDRLNSMGRQVALYLWRRLFLQWNDIRGEYFLTLHRYREEGKLRVGEPLRFLAQRLLKHVGRKTGIQAHRDQMAFSLHGKRAPQGEEGDVGPSPREKDISWAVWLEREATASMAAEPRFASTEAALGSMEQLHSLEKAAAGLPPMERATYEAQRAVANGEHESLEAALGVTPANARQRRSRMKKELRRIARGMKAHDLVERLTPRKPKK
jgi:hypothetical protein